jgi:hypothetical protein
MDFSIEGDFPAFDQPPVTPAASEDRLRRERQRRPGEPRRRDDQPRRRKPPVAKPSRALLARRMAMSLRLPARSR